MIKYILFFLLSISTLSVEAQIFTNRGKKDKAPSFELVDVNGDTISTASIQGKVVVLNFWFIGCKPCLEEIPELNEIYETYRDNPDVVFTSISIDSAKKIEKHRTKYNIRWPVVADGSAISELFKVEGYPTNIVINKKGRYELEIAGGFAKIGKVIRKAIEQALEE